jgi:hypothetical protein
MLKVNMGKESISYARRFEGIWPPSEILQCPPNTQCVTLKIDTVHPSELLEQTQTTWCGNPKKLPSLEPPPPGRPETPKFCLLLVIS